jgi:uncharacterized protein (DUF2336 family)
VLGKHELDEMLVGRAPFRGETATDVLAEIIQSDPPAPSSIDLNVPSELDEIVRSGDPKRRAEAVRRLGELFLQGAQNFHPDHVDLFDGVLTSLVPHAEIAARADLAERLSRLANAPRGLVGRLAHEDEIAIAGPLLRRSPVLDEPVLVEIARVKGQGHLSAMTERPRLAPDLTDVIIRRGDRDVVRRAAGNAGAMFSPGGYSTLIKRAGQDGVLTIKLGQRDDLSAEQLSIC